MAPDTAHFGKYGLVTILVLMTMLPHAARSSGSDGSNCLETNRVIDDACFGGTILGAHPNYYEE
jgi:hypothetical protein